MPSKKRKYKVDLVIPVYNEAGVIEKVHAQIRGVVDAPPRRFPFICCERRLGGWDGGVAAIGEAG